MNSRALIEDLIESWSAYSVIVNVNTCDIRNIEHHAASKFTSLLLHINQSSTAYFLKCSGIASSRPFVFNQDLENSRLWYRYAPSQRIVATVDPSQ
jgi:hypothetical protein